MSERGEEGGGVRTAQVEIEAAVAVADLVLGDDGSDEGGEG
jgi:hypothetical protein